ncbi:MAG: 4Fe-4S dicluster domain-containing protein [Spirochaetes bacterium]|jgi:heterodisulfide reductase subunit C|nr:4Fe-4S dicluster domain-containing protein [Spirochaetota bacterium]
MTTAHKINTETLAGKILAETEEDIKRCYQCGKCSAGCPVSTDMDFSPSLILRMLQYETREFDEDVLKSYTIWLCLTCETCIARCPQEVDIPKIFDFLRTASLNKNLVNSKAKNILSFHKSFLDVIKFNGRLYEVGLFADYKVRTKTFLEDLALAPSLFFKGKLKIIPQTVKEQLKLYKIFTKLFKKNKGIHK